MTRIFLTNTQTLRKKQTNNNDLVRTHSIYSNPLGYVHLLENPVQKYSANIDNYYEFTNLLTALAQTLGEGYAIHKQDVFIRKQFHDETNDNHEFLR